MHGRMRRLCWPEPNIQRARPSQIDTAAVNAVAGDAPPFAMSPPMAGISRGAPAAAMDAPAVPVLPGVGQPGVRRSSSPHLTCLR